ncbi:ATP-grasp domain-containing protein [Chitinimonas viridis]|uniref:ATP-grasp domain-containing protein n=1 Tax=Chitinimonas viridis TaxID=664880 RepID=A0ABT8B3E5_9NEIS|nr:ATP-grasp domain-containing protein [Chitinimonas viridis]MDN3576666.1 ATP-grasp domain-containing protein [Chitinimonas viridis]
MKTILLLGAGTGSPDAVLKLKRLGLKIVMVELRHVFDFKKCEPADEIIISDYRAPDFIDFALRLRESWHYDVAVSITEAGVAVAARINERIGSRGANLKAIGYLNDKAAMRALLKEHDFSPVASQVIRHESDLAAVIAEAGFPLIVKPVDGGGSHGIHLAHDTHEAITAVAALQAEGLLPLAEQYIDGQEYSVESFSFNGHHAIVAITEKLVNERFIEIGHVVPARLDEATAAQVARFIEDFLGLVGVTNGPCHTEMKISSKGMKIIESHNRLGGGNIPKLVELARGIDLISLNGQWATGMVEANIPSIRPKGAAAIHFFVFPEGEVIDLQGIDQLRSDPSTVEYRCSYTKGDTVPPLASNSSRAGYVVVHEADANTAIEKARHLASGVVALTR